MQPVQSFLVDNFGKKEPSRFGVETMDNVGIDLHESQQQRIANGVIETVHTSTDKKETVIVPCKDMGV